MASWVRRERAPIRPCTGRMGFVPAQALSRSSVVSDDAQLTSCKA